MIGGEKRKNFTHMHKKKKKRVTTTGDEQIRRGMRNSVRAVIQNER